MRSPVPATLLLAAVAIGAIGTAGAAECTATSGATAPHVVELFTSEGCSSCPPADRWLSTLKGRADVVALAFHVDYWDRLGWPDRFASASFTARQRERVRQLGGATVYTPQVIADGRDWRGWPDLPASPAAPPAAMPRLTLWRDGETVHARVDATAWPGARLGGYWAVLEDAHATRVRGGENAGETLRHDHVVRLYREVPAWAAPDGLEAQLPVSRGAPDFPRRVVFVVTDAATQRPLQAVALSC